MNLSENFGLQDALNTMVIRNDDTLFGIDPSQAKTLQQATMGVKKSRPEH